MPGELLLKTEKLTKQFGETIAVNQVSIEFYVGEIHGLIGENGSGKSTISSIINGIQEKTSGEMYLDGKIYEPKTSIEANKCGVSMIVQEMSTIEELTVAENIFFGNESLFTKNGVINKKKMNEQAKEYLTFYQLEHINPADDISSYNFEERKLIELVRAIYFKPKLLIIDETTTALSQDGRNELFRVIKDLKKQDVAIIIISHDLQEILGLCDKITVLRDGELVTSRKNENLMENDLKMFMIGREFTGKYYREHNPHDNHVSDEVVLEARDINIKGILKDINFELHKGEILGIGGLTDSGMHDLGKACFGALKLDKGYVKLVEKNIIIKNIRHAIKNNIAYTSKNRDQEGLLIQAGIKDNTCLSSLDKLSAGGYISPKREREFAQKYADQLKVKMQNVDQYVAELSGGNKQKVVLAKWIGRDSEILILDSPTRGIDVMVKVAIYQLMIELTKAGKSIILISEELMELIGMCDNLLVMKNGKLSGKLSRQDDLSEEKIIHYMI